MVKIKAEQEKAANNSNLFSILEHQISQLCHNTRNMYKNFNIFLYFFANNFFVVTVSFTCF